MTDRPRHENGRPRIACALLAVGICLFVPGLAESGISVYVPAESLVERSPWVVEATVRETGSGYDETSGRLATYVTLEIDRALRGEIDASTVIVRELGGSFGPWVHVSDAAPDYRVGERVVAFLEPASDGALRTSAMFFGKYSIEEDRVSGGLWASRELDGRGTIRRRPTDVPERMPIDDLRALVAATSPRPAVERRARGERERRPAGPARALRPLRVPPEYGRLQWYGVTRDPGHHDASFETQQTEAGRPSNERSGPNGLLPRFVAVDPAAPSRWSQVDGGGWVVVDVDPTGNPLGDHAAAVQQIERAMTAWTDVPESRVAVKTGDTAADFGGPSPASIYSDRNIVLFDDPFDDISDPGQNCSGVLAIGGYWRTSSIVSSVNGVDFHGAHQLYVIFNNAFACVLGDPDDLAEVATHEIGHGLGFGHSTIPDAIMRSSVYRFRGPRLGDDDADAAHCFYPHRLTLASPDGGEVWRSGDVEEISWSSTLELGPDPGVVDLEYSADDGASWSPIATGQPNDGSFFWSVPEETTTSARVRVSRSSRTGLVSSPFPARCSEDSSDAVFEIELHLPSAGAISGGNAADGGLVGRKTSWGDLEFNWGDSCSSDATDFAVYTGSLDALRQGVWDHEPVVCSTGGLKSSLMTYGTGDRYFLIAPLAGSGEGPLGRGAGETWRPSSALACATRDLATTCD